MALFLLIKNRKRFIGRPALKVEKRKNRLMIHLGNFFKKDTNK